MTAMVTASVVFLIAAVVGHGSYVDRSVGSADLVLTLVGFGILAVGGWLGGALVFVHGMHVLDEAERPGQALGTPACRLRWSRRVST